MCSGLPGAGADGGGAARGNVMTSGRRPDDWGGTSPTGMRNLAVSVRTLGGMVVSRTTPGWVSRGLRLGAGSTTGMPPGCVTPDDSPSGRRGASWESSDSLTGWRVLPDTSASTLRIASSISRALNSAVSPDLRFAAAPASGPPAASLSSTRRTMRLAPAWRYWKIASWKRRSRS